VTDDHGRDSAAAPTRLELRRRGAEVLSQLGHGTTPPRARPLYLASVEGMQHYTSDALWGSVWSRPGLTMRLRVLVTLSILACLQRLPQLRTYLNSALNLGLDAAEVQETLIQCSAFAGFPATVNAMELFREVLDSRATAVEGQQIPEVELEELDARGLSLLTQLFSAEETDGSAPPVTVAAAGDALETLTGLERRFVYGDLFCRPGLDLPERAMCALASVIALRYPEEQRAWAEGCLRVGVEPASITEIILQSAYYAGFPAARKARDVIQGLIDSGPDPGPD
jgi:4-carboxymuconolactone decarboxylase